MLWSAAFCVHAYNCEPARLEEFDENDLLQIVLPADGRIHLMLFLSRFGSCTLSQNFNYKFGDNAPPPAQSRVWETCAWLVVEDHGLDRQRPEADGVVREELIHRADRRVRLFVLNSSKMKSLK